LWCSAVDPRRDDELQKKKSAGFECFEMHREFANRGIKHWNLEKQREREREMGKES
jgi:hypothetical protein